MKKLLILVLILALCIPCLSLTAEAATIVRETYKQITWTLDSDGILTLRPTKSNIEVPKYYDFSYPWQEYVEQIEEIHILDGISFIGSNYFFGCKNVRKLVMESVTEIDEMAFNTMPCLTEVEWGIVETIGFGAFAGCESLAEVILPDTVTSIADFAFGYCERLTTVSIPNITNIPNEAFRDCLKLVCVDAPIALTVGDSAFNNCSSLTDVQMPLVESIGADAFYNCSALQTLSLPSVTSIGQNAFTYCPSLTEISLPELKEIPDNAFRFTESIQTLYAPKVLSVGVEAFYQSGITNLTLESATTIQDSAFYQCPMLETVSLPAVQTIGISAFLECAALAQLQIPSAVTIDSDAFIRCTSLTEVELPNTLQFIGKRAFASTALKTITIPASVETIQGSAFSAVSNLTSVEILGDPEMGNSVFAENDALEIVIMDALTTVPSYGFQYCYNLSRVSMAKATTVSDYAFSNCEALTEIQAPNVTQILWCAFIQCSSLEEVTFGTLTELGYSAFADCSSLTAFDMGQIEQIPSSVFHGCSSLESIVFSPIVKEIDSYAFYNCGKLASITIPATVETIGYNAFQDCTGLKTIIFEGNPPDIYNEPGCGAFLGVTANAYYPIDNPLWSVDVLLDYGGSLVWSNEGHTHAFVETRQEPTCTEPGAFSKSCDCGMQQNTVLDPLGHDFVDLVCTRCGLENTALLGDADGNGTINYRDAMLVLRASIGLDVLPEGARCDMNGDNVINYVDAMAILRTSIGL